MNLSHWIERWADFHPHRTAIRFGEEGISYAAFDARIRGVATMLRHDLGVGRGDRVAFLGYNSPDMLALLFACARLGAILVPLNWRLAPPEHGYILSHAGAALLFTEPEFAEDAAGLLPDLPGCRHLGMGEAFDALVANAAGDDLDPAAGPDDPVLLVYTSGTTGRPKGALLPQRALLYNALNSTAMHDMTSEDVILTVLPMFHVGGLNIQTTPAFHAGATVVLHRRFEPAETVRALAADEITLAVLVPAVMTAVMQHPAWPDLELSSLRALTTGSTIVPVPLIDAWLERVPVIQVYGSTETAPVAIHQRIPDADTGRGSTGRPALHCDARIVDGDGQPLGAGEKGEIVVRGPNVMTGYWKDAAATEEILRDGWFHTGDIGHTDEDGLFYVDDRLKDVIISGSENIYPAELERVLDGCPDITACAVVGRADDKWGEVPVAVVVPKPDAEFDRQKVLELFEGELARFKHPRDVVFVEDLPRNVMGKVLKFELREMVNARASG